VPQLADLRHESRLRPKIKARDAVGMQMHAGQLTVSAETVRALVDEQFPRWRGLAIRGVSSSGRLRAGSAVTIGSGHFLSTAMPGRVGSSITPGPSPGERSRSVLLDMKSLS
jgi:hypothetical protein